MLPGTNLVTQERYTEAEPLLREGLEIRQRALPEGHWLIPNTVSILGSALVGQGRFEEAEPFLVHGYEGLRDNPRAREDHTHEALRRVVDLYDAWGRPEKAAEWRVLLGTRVNRFIPCASV